MGRFKRSFAAVLIENLICISISFVSVAITARLLSAADFGILALGGAALSMVETLRECGAGVFLIRQAELTPAKVQTAFTVMVLLTFVLAAALWFSIGPLAVYFKAPALVPYLQLTIVGLIYGPLQVPITALMRRDMAFVRLAIINITRAVVAAVTMIVLALLGFGYMSVAWAGLVSAATSLMLALAFRPDLSIYRFSLVEWRPVAAYTGYDTVTAILNRGWSILPEVLIARVLGLEAVGLFGRAGSVGTIPDRFLLGALGPVVLPAFSIAARNGGALKGPYLNALSYITVLQWPALAMIIIFAKQIVLVLLGAKWLAAVPIVQVTVGAMMLGFPSYFTYPVLVATGAIRDALRSSLISLPISALIMLLAVPHGLIAIAMSMYIIVPLQVLVSLHFVRGHLGIGWRELVDSIAKSFAVTIGTVAAPLTILAILGGPADPSVAVVVFAAVAAAAAWLSGMKLSKHPFYSEFEWVLDYLVARVPALGQRSQPRI